VSRDWEPPSAPHAAAFGGMAAGVEGCLCTTCAPPPPQASPRNPLEPPSKTPVAFVHAVLITNNNC